jgi:hypothetical protein
MPLDLVTPYLEKKSGILEQIKTYFDEKKTHPILIKSIQSQIHSLDFPIQCIVIGGTNTFTTTVIDSETHLQISSLSTPLFTSASDYSDFLREIVDLKTKTLLISFAFDMRMDFDGQEPQSYLVRGSKGHIFDGLIGKDLIAETKKILPFIKKVLIWNDQVTLPLFQHLVKGKTSTFSLINGTGMNISLSNSTSISVLEPARLLINDPISREELSLELLVSGKYLYEMYCNMTGREEKSMFEILLQSSIKDETVTQLLLRSSLLFSYCIESLARDLEGETFEIDFDGSIFHRTNGYIEMILQHLQGSLPMKKFNFVPAQSQIEMMIDLTKRIK